MTDQDYMQMAYALARKGKGRTSPNPMVGAVIVKQGRIIGRGYHHRCGGPHAEVLALRQAQGRARGACLYVTLEPCFHHGRTPPCVDAIIEAGIRRVVISMKDPNPLVSGKSIAKLRRRHIRVSCGLLRGQGELLNEAFMTYITQRRPFVVAKTAQTLDGKIATAAGESKWITGRKARDYARGLRGGFDAILIGINTALADDPGLNAKRRTKRLKKIVLDAKLRLPSRARLFRGCRPEDGFVVVTPKAPGRKIESFRKRGITVLVDPTDRDRINLAWLMKELALREISSVLIEGGAGVIGSALRAKIVDKMHIYIAPRIIGDQQALSSVTGLLPGRLQQTVALNRITTESIGQDLFLQGYVAR